MRPELYACVHASEFPAQTLLRLRSNLQSDPVAVLDGCSPFEAVCALNRHARLRGAVPGMTRVEAEAMNGLRLLPRSAESERSARAAMLECGALFSPRMQDASSGMNSAFVLDIAGTERLFGPPKELAQRLRTALAAAGFRTSIAVSANYHTARLKAATSRGITIIPAGEEAHQLASLPMDALELAVEQAHIFALWGIRTIGNLAALPEDELVTRLGSASRVWRRLALGTAEHTFVPMEPTFSLREHCEFDAPVEHVDSLLFVAARMVDCLASRTAARAMALASLTVQMQLEGGKEHRVAAQPALPTTDRKFLLKLLHLEIAAHPPQAAVVGITMTGEAGLSSKVQLGLFAPQLPEPSRLDVTIARLKSLVGEDRVGSPKLEDTHRADSFRMESFSMGRSTSLLKPAHTQLVLRRIRPPAPVHVALRANRPAEFCDAEGRYVVTAAYGPWKTSGCWWSTDSWDMEEWDVLAVDHDGLMSVCLLVCDAATHEWHLEAFYD